MKTMMEDNSNAEDAAWLLRHVCQELKLSSDDIVKAGMLNKITQLPFDSAFETAVCLMQTCTGEFSPEAVSMLTGWVCAKLATETEGT